MESFEYKVKIQAENNEEAKKILAALFLIKKSVKVKNLLSLSVNTVQDEKSLDALFDMKNAVSSEDLILFAIAVKEKPHLIKRAKMFL